MYDTESFYCNVCDTLLEGECLIQIFFDEIRQLDVKTGTVLRKVKCPNTGGLIEICSVENAYIIHGELELFCYDKQLNRIWEFGGRDIFATIDDEKAFWLEGNTIHCRDWLGWHYILDLDGNLLSEECERSPPS